MTMVGYAETLHYVLPDSNCQGHIGQWFHQTERRLAGAAGAARQKRNNQYVWSIVWEDSLPTSREKRTMQWHWIEEIYAISH